MSSPSPQSTTEPSGPYHGDNMVGEETVGYLVKQLSQALHREVDQRVAPLDLTAMQWRPILLLAKGMADNPVELARLVGVDTGAMTRTLDRLEAKGLLRRLRSQTDRRRVKLELTDEGRARAGQLPYALAAAQNRLLRGISTDELDAFTGMIRRMLANGAAP
ncbi:MarR family transcriptional regulator [Verticiella sediminum]|uniref:MarR family transcriptional regulator n=1 Tax=Verticiella sediminum TaxID=1247510 RepID=A0A556AJ26_9BURK|nr:MarR family transcriptional regulator [Verticiella sediminum]TSH92870.1 MarR family transcriptional regulator [Verticiella sediminum]